MSHFEFESLPTGVIVGRSYLYDVLEYSSEAEFNSDKLKHFVQWGEWGKFGYCLRDSVRIEQIPFKGGQWWSRYSGEIRILKN